MDLEIGKEGSMQRTKGVLGGDFIQGKLGTSNEHIHGSYVLKYIQILSKKQWPFTFSGEKINAI